MISTQSISKGGKTLVRKFTAKLPAKLDLVDQNQVALIFHEIGICHGYRKPGGSWLQYAWSCFWPLHNETINIWTHFLPFLNNLFVLLSFLFDFAFTSDPYHWPFLIYLFAACIWPIVSCLAHIFGAMSQRSRHLCFLADYAALSQYSFGVALAYHAYSFDRHFFSLPFASYFPWVAAGSAVFCIGMSSYSRIMPKTFYWRRKIVRSVAFFIPYVLVNIPLAFRIGWHLWNDEGSLSEAVQGHLYQFICITTAFSLYKLVLSGNFWILHTPERIWPGKFDYIGHSHQIFHVFGAMATYFQMWAVYADLESFRHINSIRVDKIDLGLFFIVLGINLTIVAKVFQIVAPPAEEFCRENKFTTTNFDDEEKKNSKSVAEKNRYKLLQFLVEFLQKHGYYFNAELWMVREKGE